MNLVRNERIKLLATALNNSAVATVATAIIAPMAGFLYGSNSIAASRWALLSLAWLLGGLSLHIAAQLVLGRLKDDKP
jgi:hypothetical protein